MKDNRKGYKIVKIVIFYVINVTAGNSRFVEEGVKKTADEVLKTNSTITSLMLNGIKKSSSYHQITKKNKHQVFFSGLDGNYVGMERILEGLKTNASLTSLNLSGDIIDQ